MSERMRRFADYLRELGAADIDHSENTYLAHASGVYRDLKSWGCSQALCDAGMFHSIYGTELFQGFTLPLERRGEVRDLIGERAERLVYLNCCLLRASLDESVRRGQAPHTLKDRFLQQEIELSQGDFDDLCRLHLCDWLEQVARDDRWSLRRQAFRSMAERLGGVALESYDRVFAMEPAESRN